MKNKSDEKPYKEYYLIYSRKSTDDIDNQKNSLSYQVSEAIKFAKREHLRIAPLDVTSFCTSGIIKEKHTGFKEDNDSFNINADGTFSYKIERPKFFKLVKDLKDGYFKGVIFLCWDRASRNKNDDSILRKLMKLGVDIRFIQTQYDSKSSAGELHMDVDGMFSQHYSRVISEKVCNQNIKLREEGICTYRAPVGYINSGDPRNKPIDPVRGPIV
jgi:site-specific DNA recombinase